MRDNADYAKIIARGRDAYQDYTLVEAKISQFKQETLDAIAKSKITDDNGRRNLVISLQIADRVLEYLLSDIRDGKHAIEKLEEIKKVGKPSLIDRVMP